MDKKENIFENIKQKPNECPKCKRDCEIYGCIKTGLIFKKTWLECPLCNIRWRIK